MPEILENVTCKMCEALIQKSEAIEIHLVYPAHWTGLNRYRSIYLCDLCAWCVDEPIPYTVTGKGIADSMSQVADGQSND